MVYRFVYSFGDDSGTGTSSFACSARKSRISAGFAPRFTPIEDSNSIPSALMEPLALRGRWGVAGGVSAPFSPSCGIVVGDVFVVAGFGFWSMGNAGSGANAGRVAWVSVEVPS